MHIYIYMEYLDIPSCFEVFMRKLSLLHSLGMCSLNSISSCPQLQARVTKGSLVNEWTLSTSSTVFRLGNRKLQ